MRRARSPARSRRCATCRSWRRTPTRRSGRIVDALEASGHTRRDPDRDHRRPRGPDGQPVLRPAGAGRDEPAVRAEHAAVDRHPVGLQLVLRRRGPRQDEVYLDPSPAVAALRDRLAGNLAFSYQDTQIAAYLNDTSLAKKREAADGRARHARRDRELLHQRRSERLHALRHEPHDRRRSASGSSSTPTSSSTRWRTTRPRTWWASPARTSPTASWATTAAARSSSRTSRWCSTGRA